MRPGPLFWPTVLFLLLGALVIVVGLVGERNLSALADGYARVGHSRDVLDELANLRSDVRHAESASRGYRMTAERTFLDDFDSARDLSRARLGRVGELLGDRPDARAQADSLRLEIEAKLGFHEAMHVLTGTNPNDPFAGSTSAREGRAHLSRVERRLDTIRDAERALFDQRRQATDRTYGMARLAAITMAVAALLLAFLVYAQFARAVQAHRREARAQARRAGELGDAVARATAELERRAEELERSNRDLEQFAFIASHDLQEPLRKISTFADRIDLRHAGELGPEAADSLRRIRGAAGRMQQLVGNLLEFSRVARQGRAFEAVDLASVLGEVGEDLAALLEREGGRLDVGWLPRVWGDRVQLRQLFHNLAMNGLRFHREGVPPVVLVRGEIVPPVDAESPALALISVTDNGIGFEPEYAERIFGLFQRLHGRDRYEGSGLGLAIARRIAEHHRGAITAEGRPGQGAILRVELPLPPAMEDTK